MQPLAKRQKHVKHFWRKRVRIVRVARGPAAFDRLQLLQPRREHLAQLPEKLQRLRQIAQLVHQVDLRQESDSFVPQFRARAQPFAQHAMSGGSRRINAAARPALRRSFAAPQQPLALQPLQRRVDLAQLRRPKIVDAPVKDGLQVIAARRLAQQSKQNVFQAHKGTIQLFI
jgi:hypothetical protein